MNYKWRGWDLHRTSSMGKPTEIPGLALETEEDKRRFEAAKHRREVRLANKSK